MTTITVGTGQQFSTIAAAVAAARDGDTVAVSAGTYTNDFATITSKISLISVGGAVTMVGTGPMASGQALLTVTTDAVINGFVFSGARAADGTAAGVLVQGGAVLVENSLFSGNQNGLVAGNASGATLTVQASEFAGNGNGDALSHNISVGAIKTLVIQGSYIHDAVGGHEVKSLARATTIMGCRIQDNLGAALNSIDLPNGGTVVVSGNTIEKGANSTAAAAVQFGGGTTSPGSTLSVSGNVFVADRSGAVMVRNQTMQAANVSSNQVYGFATQVSGSAVASSNTVAMSRPAVSMTPLMAGGVSGGASGVVAGFGRAGAVVADGTILTVGAGGSYSSVAAAVAAAHDGDTIDVSAGVYVNDTAVISHKVIIQGVGGMAQFVDTASPASGAQFVTTTDVTFRNVEIFGANASGGGVGETAVHATGGNLTIVNSTIHDNQAGVVADKAVGGSVGIFDTEIAANGTVDGHGGNVRVAEVGSLTMSNDYVHGAVAGPEISSAADRTVLSGDRIAQSATNGSAVVALPNAGTATISNTAIEKGASGSGAVVQVGGGAAYAGSSVTLTGTTLIADSATTKTTFIANSAPGVSVAASGTTFVGGAVGSLQVVNGTSHGASVAAGGTVNTASPWGASGAPAASSLLAPVAPVGDAVAGQLLLRVSETAWHGNAQFSLTVDGAAVGGKLMATASHAAGQSQTFTVAGAYAPGPHTVGVTFLNSMEGSDGGRALFVDSMTFNGQDTKQSASLLADGTTLLSTAPTTRSTPVTVNLSEDAFHGDAMAFISIDGKVQGGVHTITASHSAGASEAMSFQLDLAPGAHTASVTLLNGISGDSQSSRNLFIDSIDVAGAHFASASASLGSGGSSNFAFTVQPAPASNGGLYVTAGAPSAMSLLVPSA